MYFSSGNVSDVHIELLGLGCLTCREMRTSRAGSQSSSTLGSLSGRGKVYRRAGVIGTSVQYGWKWLKKRTWMGEAKVVLAEVVCTIIQRWRPGPAQNSTYSVEMLKC